MEEDDAFFHVLPRTRPVPLNLSDSPPAPKRDRKRKTTSFRTRSSSLEGLSDFSADGSARDTHKKRRRSPQIEKCFTLDELRRRRSLREGLAVDQEVTETTQMQAVKDVEPRPRSPQRAALSDLSRSKAKGKQREDAEDDLAYSDFDEGYMDHERREKQSKQSALEALRLKRLAKPVAASDETPSAIAKPKPEPLPVRPKSSFRPASAVVTKAPPPSKRNASGDKAGETMQSIAARVAADISRDHQSKLAVANAKQPLPPAKKQTTLVMASSQTASRKQSEPSRPWALPAKLVSASSKTGSVAGSSKQPLPAPKPQPTASTSKPVFRTRAVGQARSSMQTIIDLDDSGPEEDEAEREDADDDEDEDEAFGMDALSPRSRKAFYAIAGLDEDGQANPSKLTEEWDFMAQEKTVKKPNARGKTWNGYRGRGKPWFRGRKKGGRGRGRGRK